MLATNSFERSWGFFPNTYFREMCEWKILFSQIQTTSALIWYIVRIINVQSILSGVL